MYIDCKSIARTIDEETLSLTSKNRARLVSLAIEPDEGTISYLKSQQKKAKSLNIDHETFVLEDVAALRQKLLELSKDETVHGIFVAHPLPKGIDEFEIASLIDPNKDVEGRNPVNLGKLMYGEESFAPCTAAAVVEILSRNMDLQGRNVVIIGRSNTVGLPLSIMLLRRDRSATVTVCHTKTRNLEEKTLQADVIVVAVGRAAFLKPEVVKDGAFVIDVGINVVGDKVVGDVDPEVEKKAIVTPVPGGVGVVTTAILMNRVARTASRGGQA
ncbi:bifunctional 5,10-methylenetetrahydrofolate dehydrogenase/5,10-methenyltetrahydrofolate cyclohydrolase [Thermotoga caldifontis]|uniref:bifunctional 5,10-methylenetetrahydrofolate dehydrogenase/5,10-methenyltetrahydrofolate cyclohydrolase n=1 Tax=Thermotoga caldifontis TaxID=1508419 RepID=UPI00059719E7|nr:bifunctional 5,10-methylenetetrahydrofolate dehydrogenase/5,10-methenyltetrahydrofolate cyclohydrolase [Thermotoga caldifontis]